MASLEYETSRGTYNSLVQLDTDTYVLTHEGNGSNGNIRTFTIPADGSTITQVEQLTHDTGGNAVFNSLIAIDANTVLLTYAGVDADGFLKTFTIPADGSTITEKIVLEHDVYFGSQNSVVQVDFDTYALAYLNSSGYGTIRTFDYSLTAATINPRISTVVIAADNSTIAVTMNEAVYNATGGSGALAASDFALTLSGGAATLSSATPSSISASSNVYTLGMSISGTPTGYEQITVTPVDNSIYDATDNEASTSQLMNQAYLHDKVGPTITGTGSLPEDNSTIAVSFSDPVYNTSGGSGALEASDFALSISGGAATLSSATPTSISISSGTAGIVDGIGHRAYGKGLAAVRCTA